MIRNYLVPFFKRILKNRAQFLVILLSIAIFFTLFIVGYYYVNFEYSYDKFHKNGENIYRVMQIGDNGWKKVKNQLPLATTAAKEIPGILSYVRLFETQSNVVIYKDKKIKAKQGFIVDSTFFEMFSFPLIKGDKSAINDPNNIFLSNDFAHKLFGDKDPIGEVISFDYVGIHLLTVRGIFKVPDNSHLQFEWIRPNNDFIKNPIFNWNSYDNFYTYFKIQSNANINDIEKKLTVIIKKNLIDDDLKACRLQPMKDIYLLTDDECKINDVTKYGNKKLISLLLLIASLITLVLWTNLLNIISVSVSNRAKEFSLRKACGAFYHQLVQQTFLETIMIVLIGGICSIPLISLVTNLALQKLDLLIRVDVLSFHFWLTFIVVAIINVFVLGFFNIIALRGIPTDRVSRYQVRSNTFEMFKRSLIMLQLAITIFIITFILIVSKQVNYMLSKDLGIEIDNIVLVQDPTAGKIDADIVNKGKTFMNEVVKNPNVLNISSTTFPGTRYYGSAGIKFNGKDMGGVTIGHIDPNFISTYNVKLLAGRNLSYTNNPWTSILVNRKMAKKLGYNNPEDVLNNTLVTDYGFRGNLEIVGVIEDYYHLSIDNPIEPVCFVLWPYSPNEFYSILVKNKNNETIAYIKEKYNAIFGENYMFDHVYLREYFNNQYSGIIKFRNIISFLMIVIVFLCCVGVYGFFSVELSKKVKSIAMRRCLGAKNYNILYTLVENYYLFILIASVITIPITYLIIKEWLNNFSDTIGLNWTLFILPVLYVIIIIFITLLNKLVSALRLNTIEALKFE